MKLSHNLNERYLERTTNNNINNNNKTNQTKQKTFCWLIKLSGFFVGASSSNYEIYNLYEQQAGQLAGQQASKSAAATKSN